MTHTSTEQPEALRLAYEQKIGDWVVGTAQWCEEVANELIRLHARVQELEAEKARAPESVPGARNHQEAKRKPRRRRLESWRLCARSRSIPQHHTGEAGMTNLQIISLACIVGNVGASIYLAKRKNWIAFTGWALASYLSIALYGVRTWE